MHLSPQLIWLDIIVEKADYQQIFLLCANLVCYFVTFSVDGKGVPLIVGYLVMLAVVISRLPKEHITLAMLVFHYVIHCWFLTMESDTISMNGLRVVYGMPSRINLHLKSLT